MSEFTDIRGDIRELRQRVTVLFWAVGITAGLTIAILGTVVQMAIQTGNLAYQVGQTNGKLDVLCNHVQMK